MIFGYDWYLGLIIFTVVTRSALLCLATFVVTRFIDAAFVAPGASVCHGNGGHEATPYVLKAPDLPHLELDIQFFFWLEHDFWVVLEHQDHQIDYLVL